jgi:hypothetical protein
MAKKNTPETPGAAKPGASKPSTRKRKPGIEIPCPRCRRPVRMRGAGDDCFSGECGHCGLEIEGVIDSLGGVTTEVYPMDGAASEEDKIVIEDHDEEYDNYFNSHPTDKEEGTE